MKKYILIIILFSLVPAISFAQEAAGDSTVVVKVKDHTFGILQPDSGIFASNIRLISRL